MVKFTIPTTGVLALAASQLVSGSFTSLSQYEFGKHQCVYGYNMQAPAHPRKTVRGNYSVVEKSTAEECALLCDKDSQCKAFEFGHN